MAAVPADSPLAAAGHAPSFVVLEMAAQAAAALAALERRGPSGPRQGYLVGARNATFNRPFLAPGELVRVTVQPTGTAGSLAVYDFTAHAGEALLAGGTISTYLVQGDG
jgi:predicted hotdog family 3-hydroxylacyl-ACP dehydratase